MEKNEYIPKLEKRRFETFKESIGEATGEIKILKTEIEEMTRKQEDVDRELDHLRQDHTSKSLADIPAVPWQIILKNSLIPKTVLSILRLASPVLEEKINLEFGKSRMDFVGEAAFSVLVRNLYLGISDLRNCTRSKSDELGMWAALGWRYLENSKFTKTRLPDTKAITEVSESINKKKSLQKVWEPFIGKVFTFDCRHLKTGQDDYWRVAKEFVKNYGKHISIIEVYTMSGRNGDLDLIDDGFLHLVPNLQYLHVWTQCNGKWNKEEYFQLEIQLGVKKCESLITLNTAACMNQYRFFDSISEIVTDTDLDLHDRVYSKELRNQSKFKNLKELELLATMKTRPFEGTDPLNFKNDLGTVESIYLNSTFSLGKTFELLRQFPWVSSVTLDHIPETTRSDRIPIYYQISQYFQFPNVKSFFYLIDKTTTKYLSAGTIFHIFPNLRYLDIVVPKLRKHEFTQCLKTEISGPAAAPRTDMFQFYRDGGSLKNSNIWKICKSLSVLTFKTQMRGKREYSTRIFEIYTRNADGFVVFEKRFQNLCCDYRPRFRETS